MSLTKACVVAGAYVHGLTGSLAAPAGYNGITGQPLAVPGSAMARPALPKQGFMPYKWHAQQGQQACGAQQLPPGVFSLGKRSASASLLEPPQKRQHTDALS